jgi:proteasome lid subunit RPN8/RPN11
MLDYNQIAFSSELQNETPRKGELKIYISSLLLNETDSYLRTDLKNELGGVFIGDYFEDSDGETCVIIEDIIIAEFVKASITHLTFTSETWQEINNTLEEKHSGKKITGWFHSHPGHSVFMSGYDKFIQENFFNQPFMTAYVYDPVRNERGFFFNKAGKTELARGFFLLTPGDKTEIINIMEEKKSVKSELQPALIKKIYIGLFLLFALNLVIGVYLLIKTNSLNEDINKLSDISLKINEIKSDYKLMNEKIDVINSNNKVSGDSFLYKIREGDNLKKLAFTFYNDSSKFILIVKYNNLRDEYDISPGKSIEIPVIIE